MENQTKKLDEGASLISSPCPFSLKKKKFEVSFLNPESLRGKLSSNSYRITPYGPQCTPFCKIPYLFLECTALWIYTPAFSTVGKTKMAGKFWVTRVWKVFFLSHSQKVISVDLREKWIYENKKWVYTTPPNKIKGSGRIIDRLAGRK